MYRMSVQKCLIIKGWHCGWTWGYRNGSICSICNSIDNRDLRKRNKASTTRCKKKLASSPPLPFEPFFPQRIWINAWQNIVMKESNKCLVTGAKYSTCSLSLYFQRGEKTLVNLICVTSKLAWISRFNSLKTSKRLSQFVLAKKIQSIRISFMKFNFLNRKDNQRIDGKENIYSS